MLLIHLAGFLGALLLATFLTWYVRRLATAHGWAVSPAGPRHVHATPHPRLGGVAIYASVVVVTVLTVTVSRVFHLNLPLTPYPVAAILVPATMVFLLGLYDDCRSLSPYAKLSGQAVAAAVLFLAGYRVLRLPLLFGSVEFGAVAALVGTVLWVLVLTNAFNLLDGLDGLAAGSALFPIMVLFVLSLINNNDVVSFLAVVLAGAILGFLRFNFLPASIFLGDCGSLFIGFLLGALAIAGAQKTTVLVAVAIPIVAFGLPLLDTAIAVVRRFLSGQPLFTADREHIHHKLLQRGLSQRQAVVLLYAFSAACSLLSLLLLYPAGAVIGIVLFIFGVGIWLGVQYLGYHEFFEITRVAKRTIDQRLVIINNLAVRRANEKLAGLRDLPQICQLLEATFQNNDFDGFSLVAVPDSSPVPAGAQPAAVRMGGGDDYRHDWHKTQNSVDHASQSLPAWSLTLELVTSQGRRVGRFSVHREYGSRPLLMDINLLTEKFAHSLAEAVHRAALPTAEAMETRDPVPLKAKASRAAAAGM